MYVSIRYNIGTKFFQQNNNQVDCEYKATLFNKLNNKNKWKVIRLTMLI